MAHIVEIENRAWTAADRQHQLRGTGVRSRPVFWKIPTHRQSPNRDTAFGGKGPEDPRARSEDSTARVHGSLPRPAVIEAKPDRRHSATGSERAYARARRHRHMTGYRDRPGPMAPLWDPKSPSGLGLRACK